jgi:hypothetical protein
MGASRCRSSRTDAGDEMVPLRALGIWRPKSNGPGDHAHLFLRGGTAKARVMTFRARFILSTLWPYALALVALAVAVFAYERVRDPPRLTAAGDERKIILTNLSSSATGPVYGGDIAIPPGSEAVCDEQASGKWTCKIGLPSVVEHAK